MAPEHRWTVGSALATTVIVNEGSNVSLSCTSPAVIRTVSAVYGQPGHTCDATAFTRTTCDGKGSCTFLAANYICGDPDGGVPKQITVDYLCSTSTTLRGLQIAATQTVATISGQVITGQVWDAIDDAFNGPNPITLGPNGLHFAFTAEPPQDLTTQEAFDALAYAANVYKAPPMPLIQRDWNVWADVRGTGFNQNIAGGSANEKQINITGGVGYKVTPDLQVGTFTGYENFNFTSPLLAGTMNGSGGTIGSYAAWRFVDHWRLDGMFGWSDVFYNGTAGTAAGSFTGSRWLGAGGFTGTYRLSGFVLEPSARIYTLWERDNAFTDSLGTAQPVNAFSESRVSTGGKASYPWQAWSNISVVPYLGLYTDYRFSTSNALPVGIPYVGVVNGWSERVTTGVTITRGRNGPSLSLGAELGGIGAGYDLWSANARLNWPV